MPEAAASAAPSAGVISDEEMQAAFGGDLGAGPGASASAIATAPAPPGGDTAAETVDTTSEAHESTPTWNEFVHGWDLGLYRDPVLCGVFAGLVLGLLGVFIVLRRAVFVTAAVSQAAGLGVALAFLLEIKFGASIPPVLGALVLALAATWLLTYRVQRMRLPRETLVGLLYLCCSAAAVLVGDRIAQEAHDISSILFGTAVLVQKTDLYLVGGAGALALLATLVGYRGLLFAGFDPDGARVHGLPVQALDLLLWSLVALEVSVTTRAMGALPVFAFAVLPAMAALALAERLRWALVIAALLGALAGGAGYLFAFFYEFPVGASQATLATVFLLLSLPLARMLRGSAT
jgi:manganese/iron transport system permease protein